MIVYGVGEGEYENYGVRALYTNRDHADAAARACGGDVYEYDLDEPLTDAESAYLRPGEHLYRVGLEPNQKPQAWEAWHAAPRPSSYRPASDRFSAECWATSEADAISKAKQIRDEWEASGKPLGTAGTYGWCEVV